MTKLSGDEFATTVVLIRLIVLSGVGADPSVETVGRKARLISNVRETNIVSNLNKTIARNKEHIGASHTPHSHCISFVSMAKVEHELTLAFDSITVD